MTLRNKPDDIDSKIWASTGDVESPSSLEIAEGWEPAEKPFSQYANWIENRQDCFIAHINQHGIAVWDQSTLYKAYKSYVQADDSNIYLAKQDNQDVNPVGDTLGTYWIKVLDKSGAVCWDNLSSYFKTLLLSEDGQALLDAVGMTPTGVGLAFAGDAAAGRAVLGTDIYLDRSNHTGTQAQSTITDLTTDLAAKELLANKATDFSVLNNTKYPTTNAVANYVQTLVAGETYQGQWDAINNDPPLVSGVGTEGDVWQVSVADEVDPNNNTELDGIKDWKVNDEVVFSGGAWVKRAVAIPSLTTDDVTEATNQYFTESRVRSTPMGELSLANSTAVVSTDTLIVAIGKLQAQIDAMQSRLLPSGGTTGQVLAKASGTNYATTWSNSNLTLSYPVHNIGAGTKTLDCSSYNYWNISGNGTCNIINLPTGNVVFTGYIRFTGGTSLSFTAPGKSFSWAGGVTPTLNSSQYNLIMFTNVLGGSRVNLMLVDQGVL